jgi:hypothetical protein
VLWEQTGLKEVSYKWNHDLLGLFIKKLTHNTQESLRDMIRLGVERGFCASMRLVELNNRFG